jgi:hydrogenase maturation protease
MNILIAGIGNIFEGDDAFGCEVARTLMTRELPDHIRVVDFGIRGMDLTYALMDKPDLTILIDATRQGGAPGTVYTMEPSVTGGSAATLDTHAMDPLRVLRTAQAMCGEIGERLGRILLVGCEPADLGGEDGRMGLTPPVAEAVEYAADLVISLVQKESRQREFMEVQHV